MTSSEPIYTLADLDTWSFPGTALAVLGHPIKHSISPPMQNAALAAMARTDARFASWKYFRFDITPQELPDALVKFHDCGFRGLNLTIPHKVIAFNLGGLVNTMLSSNAGYIGAVNTLTAFKDGSWDGENTDGYGLETSLKEELGVSLEGTDVILLGAGGAARGAAVTAIQRKCRSLWICNRTDENRKELINRLLLAAFSQNVQLRDFPPSELPSDLPKKALVINATSAGLKPSDDLPIDLDDLVRLARPAGIYDMIYNPPETRLLAQARALGIPAANGLSMLVHQGVRSLEIWTGAAVPVDAMRTAVHSAMNLPA